jgi:uncharacterized protein
MKKAILSAFGAALLAAPQIVVAQTAEIKVTAANPVVAIGVTGTEEAMPDMATITAGVEVKLPDAKKALDKANQDMAKVIAVVKAAGIQPKDIQTDGVSVEENIDYAQDNPKPDGYRAFSRITLTVRDLSRLKTLVGDIVAAGANELRGPNFSIDNEDALTDKARMKAFDTAKRRAMAYATKAGFKSVRLLKVSEDAGYEAAMGYAAEAGADAAAAGAAPPEEKIVETPIEPGLISRSVTATFHFEMVP